MRKAKVAARGTTAIQRYMTTFHHRNANNRLTMVTPFKTVKNAHIYIEVQPHQVREMLEVWRVQDIHMSDRIILYRLEPYSYHLTFEGLEAIPV